MQKSTVYYVDKIFFFKLKQLPFKNKSNFWYTSGTSGEIPNPNFSIYLMYKLSWFEGSWMLMGKASCLLTPPTPMRILTVEVGV